MFRFSFFFIDLAVGQAVNQQVAPVGGSLKDTIDEDFSQPDFLELISQMESKCLSLSLSPSLPGE